MIYVGAYRKTDVRVHIHAYHVYTHRSRGIVYTMYIRLYVSVFCSVRRAVFSHICMLARALPAAEGGQQADGPGQREKDGGPSSVSEAYMHTYVAPRLCNNDGNLPSFNDIHSNWKDA